MLNTKINNNYTLNTNYMLQGIAELSETTQQTSTPAPVAQVQATPITKTPKTNKITTPIINTTYKSTSTQHGHYVPSQNKTNIKSTTHTTSLTIILAHSSAMHGYSLQVKVNGEAQVSVVGDADYSDWKLALQAGDIVEVTVIGGKSTKNITYTINEDGVVASASEGVKHSLKGSHKEALDIQDKYRKEAAQETAVEPTPAQEETTIEAAPVAQIEEETAPVAAQVLDFGKHAGKTIEECGESYWRWLANREGQLKEGNRWACTAAKALLAARQTTKEAA